jgi:hypothetical protein
MLTRCPACGTVGKGLSVCTQCGEFISMNLAAPLWTVNKLKDGAKAGKWVIVGINGSTGWFYNTEQSAERDCRLLNLSEALPATGGQRLRNVQLEADILGLRAEHTKLIDAVTAITKQQLDKGEFNEH